MSVLIRRNIIFWAFIPGPPSVWNLLYWEGFLTGVGVTIRGRLLLERVWASLAIERAVPQEALEGAAMHTPIKPPTPNIKGPVA